ncbi:hypothetical protein P171DRAFT_153719 [Karstenula rhodostoma CBS 690.94]|uniref:Zn(2)-C6 fungal-type domain-containing protein n=1 Tax=Karstenula rhodostoma CBS 690.94 TaxID=1392251 RepID=A0A9P4PTM8_9PLEO|nr:hypothetical protein P171DRAFT_153719 [Karstenula rhodostoma CBS 690.94]
MFLANNKKRRKKCDEEKPICQRCRDDQFKCDGYASVPPRKKKPAAQRHTSSKDQTLNPKSTSIEKSMRQITQYYLVSGTLINLDPGAQGPGGSFFHHFRSVTVVDLIRVVNPGDFWFRRVLPMCHDDPVVRQVVVALGAAHRCYLGNLSKPSAGDANAPLTHSEGVAVSLYNEAIAKLTGIGVESYRSGDRELKFLICCLLFVCLEYMLGRFDEAVRHIKAGCQLFQASGLSTAPDDVRKLFQETGTVFLHLIVDATIPPHVYDIPNMLTHAKPLKEIDDASQPFSSLAEARDASWDLDVRMAYSSHGPDNEHKKSFEGLEKPGLQNCNEGWKELSILFAIWRSKLNLLISSLGNVNALPIDLQREVLVLRAQLYMWETILYPDDGLEDEGLRDLCHDHIDLIEKIYRIEASWMGRPVFTLDSDTIPAMFHAATYCKNPVFTERVVGLLRQYRRREGMWDSWKVADMLSM